MTAPTPQHAEPVGPLGEWGSEKMAEALRDALLELMEWREGKRAHPVAAPQHADGIPPHDCEYLSDPERGRCEGHEMFAAGYAQAELVAEFDSRPAPDTDRYRWLKMKATSTQQHQILCTPWTKWDAEIDAMRDAHPVAAKPAFDIDEAMRLADEYANWEPVERDTNWHAERAALEAYLKANT